jgi:hypothetical protein
VIARVLAAALALAPASVSAAAGTAPPALALTAAPSHVTLAGSGGTTIRVANPGAAPILVEAAPAGFTLSLRGRPRVLLTGVAARRAASWLSVRPPRLVLEPGRSAEVMLTASPPRGATAGDYPALVLLTAQAARDTGVAVRMRAGITVTLRVSGTTHHRLVVRSVHVRHVPRGRVVEIVVRNDGNVVERLPRGRMRVTLAVRGRVVARLRSAAPRELLPHAPALFELAYRGTARGLATAVVELSREHHAFRLRM